MSAGTASANGRRVLSAEVIVRRVDKLLAADTGESLPEETVVAISSAVQEQIIGPLLASGPAPVCEVDHSEIDRQRQRADSADRQVEIARCEIDRLSGELEAARTPDDYEQLRTIAAEHAEVIDRQTAEIDMLRTQLGAAAHDDSSARARAEVFRRERNEAVAGLDAVKRSLERALQDEQFWKSAYDKTCRQHQELLAAVREVHKVELRQIREQRDGCPAAERRS